MLCQGKDMFAVYANDKKEETHKMNIHTQVHITPWIVSYLDSEICQVGETFGWKAVKKPFAFNWIDFQIQFWIREF